MGGDASFRTSSNGTRGLESDCAENATAPPRQPWRSALSDGGFDYAVVTAEACLAISTPR